jgi:hypothetical protein
MQSEKRGFLYSGHKGINFLVVQEHGKNLKFDRFLTIYLIN